LSPVAAAGARAVCALAGALVYVPPCALGNTVASAAPAALVRKLRRVVAFFGSSLIAGTSSNRAI
jgi:hypothetical protein